MKLNRTVAVDTDKKKEIEQTIRVLQQETTEATSLENNTAVWDGRLWRGYTKIVHALQYSPDFVVANVDAEGNFGGKLFGIRVRVVGDEVITAMNPNDTAAYVPVIIRRISSGVR